jgi:hypothetical protein
MFHHCLLESALRTRANWSLVARYDIQDKFMRLRQVALVATKLAPVRRQIFSLLGLDRDFKDPGVEEFGLENSVMTIGDTYLEVVAPVKEDTTAGRLLERRNGDGGYMVIVQTDDLARESERVEKLGVRKVWEVDLPDAKAFHMHPKDLGGAIASIDQMNPPESWRWAGHDWQKRRASLVDETVGVEIQSEDVDEMADRWADVFGREVSFGEDCLTIVLERGQIRFVEDLNGRGDGVSGVDFRTRKLDSIVDIAKQQGLKTEGNKITVCGTDFRFYR